MNSLEKSLSYQRQNSDLMYVSPGSTQSLTSTSQLSHSNISSLDTFSRKKSIKQEFNFEDWLSEVELSNVETQIDALNLTLKKDFKDKKNYLDPKEAKLYQNLIQNFFNWNFKENNFEKVVEILKLFACNVKSISSSKDNLYIKVKAILSLTELEIKPAKDFFNCVSYFCLMESIEFKNNFDLSQQNKKKLYSVF